MAIEPTNTAKRLLMPVAEQGGYQHTFAPGEAPDAVAAGNFRL
jgi:hypothetical protein